MEDFKGIDQKIDESLERFSAPFDDSSVQRAKANVLGKISLVSESNEQIASVKLNPYLWTQVAAILAVVFTAAIILFLSGNQRLENLSAEQSKVLLPDGSEVVLEPQSCIKLNSYSWFINRTLTFSGEGYFKVKSGNKFTVKATGGDVEVLGTEFTLWVNHSDLFVHCTEGSVKISNSSGMSILNPNEFLCVEEGLLSPKNSYFVQGFIFPRYGFNLSYDSVPVGIVISELERVLELQIKNGLPSNLIYTGTLDISDVNRCFEIFCKPFGAKFNRTADGYVSIYLE